jgi:nitroreductase
VTGISEAITARYSCRTFDARPLEASERGRVEELVNGPHEVPFGSRIRFALIDAGRSGSPDAARLGTYGVIRGAPCFIAGAVRERRGGLEDFGFAFERIVLGLTTMGLATCWLAGTYRRGGFVERLALEGDEILPAVTPVGHPAARPSAIDAVFRAGARSTRRLAWERLFTVSREEAGPWASCLEAVRRGPSATNGQPWRIAKEPNRPVFHLGLAGPAPAPSFRRLDAGIAMCHFALVAAELGLAGAWIAPGASNETNRPLLPPGTVHVASWIPA